MWWATPGCEIVIGEAAALPRPQWMLAPRAPAGEGRPQPELPAALWVWPPERARPRDWAERLSEEEASTAAQVGELWLRSAHLERAPSGEPRSLGALWAPGLGEAEIERWSARLGTSEALLFGSDGAARGFGAAEVPGGPDPSPRGVGPPG